MNPPPDHNLLLAELGWVRRLARRLVGDVHLAEDLVQEVLVVALEGAQGQRFTGAPRAWLAAVLRNRASKSRRGSGRREERERSAARVEAQPPGSAALERAQLHRALVKQVMELDEPYRAAVLLRYLDELPPRAIARKLGVPVSTVNTRLARGLAQLRERLEGRGGKAQWLPALVGLAWPERPIPLAVAGALAMQPKIQSALALVVVALSIGTFFMVDGLRAVSADTDHERTDTEEVAGLNLEGAASDAEEEALAGAEAPAEERQVLAVEALADPPQEPKAQPAPLPTGDVNFHGRVVDAGGAPIRTARIWLENAKTWGASFLANQDSAGFARTTSDEQGRFELLAPSWEPCVGALVAEGYAADLFPLSTGHPSAESAKVLRLELEPRVTVRIIDGSGAPLAGLEVRFTLPVYMLRGEGGMGLYAWTPDPVWSATSNEDGVARVRALPCGFPLRFDVRRAGRVVYYEAAAVQAFSADEERRFDVQLGRASAITGEIVDTSGQALAGKKLWLLPCLDGRESYVTRIDEQKVVAHATSDKDGLFTFEDVGAGRWLVGLASTVYPGAPPAPDALSTLARVVEVPGSGAPVRLVVESGLDMRGKVLDSFGKPLAGAMIVAIREGSSGLQMGRSMGDGSFVIGPLTAGAHTLTVQWNATRSDPTQAQAGAQDVVLTLDAGGGIRGTVAVTEGQTTAATVLWFTRSDAQPMERNSKAYQLLGHTSFDMQGLSAGRHTVYARAEEGAVIMLGDVEVITGETTDVGELQLVPAALVELTIAGDGAWAQLELWAGEVRYLSTATALKQERLLVALPGKLRVKATLMPSGKVVEREIEVSPGERLDLEL